MAPAPATVHIYQNGDRELPTEKNSERPEWLLHSTHGMHSEKWACIQCHCVKRHSSQICNDRMRRVFRMGDSSIMPKIEYCLCSHLLQCRTR